MKYNIYVMYGFCYINRFPDYMSRCGIINLMIIFVNMICYGNDYIKYDCMNDDVNKQKSPYWGFCTNIMKI